MDIEKIHPELHKAYKRAPAIPVHKKWVVSLANLILKFRPKKKSIDGVMIENRKTSNASVRVYSPPTQSTDACLLWIHGGGLLIGNPAINDQLCADYAKDFNMVVVSVGYRLADKHPFPAGIDDCFNGWLWLQQEAGNLGVDPARIVISGQSAGGGLAAALVQRIVDSGGVQPAGQALLCPMLDDRTAAREELDSINHKLWNNRNNRVGWSAYLDQPVGMSSVADYAVPARREDLSGLPPTWIGIGDIDLFYEESKRYSERLREGGVSCEFYAVPMGPHGFELLAPEASITRDFFKSNYSFLRETLNL